jgi:hypothetical protein
MRYLLVLSFLFFSSSLIAQTDKAKIKTTIHGTIADFVTKRPIENATVVLYNTSGTELSRVTTNAKGAFSFGELTAATYNLKYEAAGYQSQTRKKLPLQANKRVRVAILLQPNKSS